MPLQEPPPLGDRNARIYTLVFICEAITITALWVLGRIFS
jgi:hypothetical protein